MQCYFIHLEPARPAQAPADKPTNGCPRPDGEAPVAMETDEIANGEAAPAASVSSESEAGVPSHMAELAVGVKKYAPILEKCM